MLPTPAPAARDDTGACVGTELWPVRLAADTILWPAQDTVGRRDTAALVIGITDSEAPVAPVCRW